MKTISVIIPFFNEEDNLQKIYDELKVVRQSSLSQYRFEILLMDNHSSDTSFEIASELAKKDDAVKVLRLSRNFGYQANILSGFLNCSGDAAIQLDADGEDDPHLIIQFIEKWEAGYDVVYGIRIRRSESWLLTFQRKAFYRILASISTLSIPVDAGDFRLLDRKVLTALSSFKEANPYLRGLIAYAGFRQIGIPYSRRPRYRGVSKFSWWEYLSLALDGITSFSAKPLKIATWIGFGLSIFSLAASFYYLILFFEGKVSTPGFTTLILVMLLLAGVQLLCTGLIGTYIGAIFNEVKQRPRSIIEKKFPEDKI